MKKAGKIFFLILLGAFSIYLTLLRNPNKTAFGEWGTIDTSRFNITIYNNQKDMILSISPLNDYYYQDGSKGHFLNQITKSNNGSILQNFSSTIQSLYIGRKVLFWNSEGENNQGRAEAHYKITSQKGIIEISRKIKTDKNITQIGQVLSFCSNCLVADDKKRIFFNGDLLTDEKIQLATNLDRVPIILGQNQSFPEDLSKILVLTKEGKTQIEIPVMQNSQIFLQEEWHFLEFKTPVVDNIKPETEQIIHLPKIW